MAYQACKTKQAFIS